VSIATRLIAVRSCPVPCFARRIWKRLTRSQDAEAKKDSALVIKWAAETSRLARAQAAAPEPAAAAEKEPWKESVAYAKQVEHVHGVFAVRARAAGTTPADVMSLHGALEAQNPKSPYLPKIDSVFLIALGQSKNTAKMVPFAEARDRAQSGERGSADGSRGRLSGAQGVRQGPSRPRTK